MLLGLGYLITQPTKENFIKDKTENRACKTSDLGGKETRKKKWGACVGYCWCCVCASSRTCRFHYSLVRSRGSIGRTTKLPSIRRREEKKETGKKKRRKPSRVQWQRMVIMSVVDLSPQEFSFEDLNEIRRRTLTNMIHLRVAMDM